MKTLVCLIALTLLACGESVGNPNVSVCIDPEFSDGMIESIIIAGREWHNASGGRVNPTFAIGKDCGELEIRAVSYLRQKDGVHVLGITSVEDDLIRISVEDTYSDGSHPKDYDARVIAEHELGHYWTGSYHSENPKDIMYFRVDTVINTIAKLGGRKHLTPADISRL